MTALLVALGAAAGAAARFGVAVKVPGLRATLLVNVLGSFALGLLLHRSPSTYALLGTGFCGAFTTYSAFAVEVVETWSWRYVAASVGLCVGAVSLGQWLAG